ncbi:hypothetical protein QBC41DRAFT_225083, partial [Cercophora samala]
NRNERLQRRESTVASVPLSVDQTSSSSPLVRHVSRPRTNSLARRHHPDSQDTNSAIAHVSRTIPKVQSSHRLSNSRWNNWFHREEASYGEADGGTQSLPEVRISPGVSQRYQQETESSWPGLSEDLPPFPHHEEYTSTGRDHSMKQTVTRGSEDTSEALDRYEQLLAIVQGDQWYEAHSHPVTTTDNSTGTENSDLNALSSPVEGGMCRNNPTSRGTKRLNDGSFLDSSSSLNLTKRFGDESTGTSCFSSFGTSQIDDLTHGDAEFRGTGSLYDDRENTIIPSEPQTLQTTLSRTLSSGNVANLWPEHSPSLESSGTPSRLNTIQTLEADEGWRSFVFGDDNSDIIESAAFIQASRDAARALQPTESSDLSCVTEPADIEHNSTGATGFPPYAVDSSQPSGSVEPWSSLDVPSLGAIASSSVVESDAGIFASHIDRSDQGAPQSNNEDAHSQSIHCASIISKEPDNEVFDGQGYTHLSDEEPTRESVGQEFPRGEPSRADALEPAQYVGSNSSGSLPASGDLSSIASALAPPRSVGVKRSGVQGVEEQARFAPPKLFMGSRSQPQERYKAPVVLRATTKRRGRPKRRAVDGRADIRSIPNYTSDPIEDFEDQQPVHTSIFPALELA